MAITDTSFARLAFKASHNSYCAPPVVDHLAWSPVAPHRGGCRGVELDVIQSDNGWKWSVQHGGEWRDDSAAQLNTYLRDLAAWSVQRQGNHDVVMIHINLKNSRNSHTKFPAAFDGYVTSAMPGVEFFKPGALLNGSRDLLSGAKKRGWPTLGELHGKFMLCLTGHQDERTDTYIATKLLERLCFCDTEVADPTNPDVPDSSQPNRVIYNFAPLYHRNDWVEAMAKVSDRDAFLIRAYEVNDQQTWRLVRAARINIISTDQVFFTKWAHVGALLFAPRIEDLPRLAPAVRTRGVVAGPRRLERTADLTRAEELPGEELPADDLREELRRLRREHRILLRERRILTRALAVLARESID